MHTSLTSAPVVVLDANALFPLSLRDLLFRAVEKGLYRLRISRDIWDEVIRNLIENGRMTPEGAAYLDMRVRDSSPRTMPLSAGTRLSSQPSRTIPRIATCLQPPSTHMQRRSLPST